MAKIGSGGEMSDEKKGRRSTGKRLRFEVLKRDGFRCVYCGASPLDVPLHVDHVIAVANGGTDDPANLVTACADCNGGKSAVPLEQRKLTNNRDPEALKEQVEQIREYLAAQREVSDAKNEAIEEMLDRWHEIVGREPRQLRARLPKLLSDWGVAKLVEAFEIVARGAIRGGTDDQLKYLYGVLRRWRTEIAPEPPQVVTNPKPQPSRHSLRVRKAVNDEIAKINAEPPSGKDDEEVLLAARRGVLQRFAKAAWHMDGDHAYAPWGATDHRVRQDIHECRGIRLTFSGRDVAVADIPGFNPHEEAFRELQGHIERVAPNSETPLEDLLFEVGDLWANKQATEVWLRLFTEPDSLEDIRAHHPHVIAKWEVE